MAGARPKRAKKAAKAKPKRAAPLKRTAPAKRAAPPKRAAAPPKRAAAPPRRKRAAPPKRAAAPPKRAAAPPRRKRAATPASTVVSLVDNEDPVTALRRFLDAVPAHATVSQGQIALGSAQLMLLPLAREHAGEVRGLVDLVLARWDAFPDRAGFHAQEFLRNAIAAIGDDADRLARLVALVPADASPELRLEVACAYAVAGDRPGMLAAIDAALVAGVSPAQVRRDADLAAHAGDPDVAGLLARAEAPTPIPVDIAPFVEPMRAAVDRAASTITALGESVSLNPPTSLDAVLAIETARRVALPNEYRALLTLHDGMTLWGVAFLGTADLRGDTALARRARAFLDSSADYGAAGVEQCVPIANWGQPNSWLVYDPRGAFRSGEPGYVILSSADEWPQSSLVAALGQLAATARDVLGGETN
jgi:hypothetical protein